MLAVRSLFQADLLCLIYFQYRLPSAFINWGCILGCIFTYLAHLSIRDIKDRCVGLTLATAC